MPEFPREDEFREYRDYLLALARSQISVDLRCQIDPSDLVQDTICDALRSPQQIRERPQTLGWLRRILHDNLIDQLRRLRHKNRVASIDALLERTSARISQFLVCDNTHPQVKAMREENEQILADLLGKLSSAQAEAIILKHCQGLSVAAIGRHMNKSPVAVGGLLRHGMLRLRELMNRED